MKKSKALRRALSVLVAAVLTMQTLPAAVLANEKPVVHSAPASTTSTVKKNADTFTYVQNLESGSILDAKVVSVNGEAAFGMDGKALRYQTNSGDVRMMLMDTEAMLDGSYEVAFRTEKDIMGNLGFLVRYSSEESYIGFSMDDETGWVAHYSKPGKGRANEPLGKGPKKLEPDTGYKIKLTYKGNQQTLEFMKEGDKEYANLGTAPINGGTATTPGRFAIRINPGSMSGNSIIIDNLKQYDAEGKLVKELNFNDLTAAPEYEARSNRGGASDKSKATLTLKEMPTAEAAPGLATGKATKLTQTGVHVDTASPFSDKVVYDVKVSADTETIGLVYSYADAENYATIQYDGEKWIAGGMNAGKAVSVDLSDKKIPAPKAGEAHTFGLNTQEGTVLTLDGKTYDLGALEGVYTAGGQIGLVTGENTTLYAEPITVEAAVKAPELAEPTENFITLKSDEMQVLVGDSFPTIYTYKSADGTKQLAYGEMVGQERTEMYIYTGLIEAGSGSDGKLDEHTRVQCKTASQKVAQTENSATYKVTALNVEESVNAVFTVKLTVEGNTMKQEILNVHTERGSKLVRAFGFDNSMLTMAGTGAGAAMGIINIGKTGWGPAADKFVTNREPANQTIDSLTYAMLYDDIRGVSASVENNAVDAADKYRFEQKAGEVPTLEVGIKNWAWNFFDNTVPAEQDTPYMSVVIGADENNDGAITWQDAGVAYRDIMHKAYGSEHVKNEWMFIAMNMSSQASHPFLRVLDNAKAFSYLTDGFGMKIMNKGYQAGGHDDSHGDYEFVGIQQDGVVGFNYLINEGLKYGIKNGVHINMTEFALDSRAAKENIMLNMNTDSGLRPNWCWFDQAYLVDKGADVDTGSLKARLDAFEAAVPNLDFAYVDVYQSGSDYRARQAAKYMNDNGLNIGTEALSDFNQDVTFVHWNTDLYYPCGGSQSQVLRFVTNSVGDMGAPDRALMGALMPGVADWRNTNVFHDAQTTFYRENLPTKYLQYFDLLKWTPNESAEFSENVKSTVEEKDGKFTTTITKDDKVIAVIDTTSILTIDQYAGKPSPRRAGAAEIFMPWSPVVEDKIYSYSDKGGQTTWDLPASWDGVKTAYLYQLTNNGRSDVQEVKTEGGKITLDLTAGVPYILVKEQNAQAHLYDTEGKPAADIPLPEGENAWGQGSTIKNFGFTSRDLRGWNTSEGAVVDTTFTGTSRTATTQGDPRLMFPAGEAAFAAQTMDVKPGATYTFSTWVISEGDRPVTLSVKAGDVVETAALDTTAGMPVRIKPSKYLGYNAQRMRVTVAIPEDVTTAELSFHADAGEAPVYADDFRSWEWPEMAQPNAKVDDYYYFEDFENLDENWGPFQSLQGSQPHSHLVYRFEDGSQAKYYTVDGDVSLHIRGDARCQEMRTLPSTVNFEQGAEYQVDFDYQAYREVRAKGGTVDLAGNPVPSKFSGCNYPMADANSFLVTVRHADGSVIESFPVKPSTFEEGTDINNFELNSRPSTEKMTFKIDAKAEAGIYLTIDSVGGESDKMMAIDNFSVTKLTESVDKKDLKGAVALAAAKAQNGYTEESWTAFTEALAAAEAVKADAKADQKQVDAAVEALIAAMDALTETPELPEVSFPDVNEGQWFYKGVTYTAQRGYMKGMTDGTFAPDVTMTRAQLVQVLYAMADKPKVEITDEFSDVKAGQWYADAASWAVEKGITAGVGDGTFAPNKEITRQEIAVMLHAANGKAAAEGELNFADNADIDTWAVEGVKWAVENGLMKGVNGNKFAPKEKATRAEAATIAMNLDQLAK